MCPVSCSGQWQMIRKQLEEWKIHSVVFPLGHIVHFWQKNSAPKAAGLIAPDWSVSINLVSPFLNEFLILIFEVAQQLNFQHSDALWEGTSIYVIVAFHKTIRIEPPLSISVWCQTCQNYHFTKEGGDTFIFFPNCGLYQSCLQFSLHIFCGFPLLNTGSLVNNLISSTSSHANQNVTACK